MIGNYIELNNGVKYPQIGFGTFLCGSNDCYISVKAAIDAGYR